METEQNKKIKIDKVNKKEKNKEKNKMTNETINRIFYNKIRKIH